MTSISSRKTIVLMNLVTCACLCLHACSASASSSSSSSTVLEDGPNVCEKEEEFNSTRLVHQPVPYQVKTFVWCARIPPRCASTRTAYRTGWRNETTLTKKMIRLCCEGFAQVEGRCLPRQQQFVIVNGSSTLMSETLRGMSDDNSAGSSIGIWAGMCLTLLLVIAFIMLILFQYKKKLHQVKEELNYVTYTSDRSGSCGAASSVGNLSSPPVYAQVNANETNIPNNSVKHFVVNDLKSGQQNKESNLERAAVLKKEAAFDADLPSILSSSGKAGASSSGSTAAAYDIPDVPLPPLPTEAKTAAAPFNPNLYHGSRSKDIDKEPIYEELKEPALLPPAAAAPPALPPTTLERRKQRSQLSPQLSDASSVYDMPRSSLSRSSSRGSSVADNNCISPASTSSASYSLTPSPAKIANNTKILNRVSEQDSFDPSLPSTSFRMPCASRVTHRLQVEEEDDEDRSLTEDKIYANDVNCHQKEI